MIISKKRFAYVTAKIIYRRIKELGAYHTFRTSSDVRIMSFKHLCEQLEQRNVQDVFNRVFWISLSQGMQSLNIDERRLKTSIEMLKAYDEMNKRHLLTKDSDIFKSLVRYEFDFLKDYFSSYTMSFIRGLNKEHKLDSLLYYYEKYKPLRLQNHTIKEIETLLKKNNKKKKKTVTKAKK